MPDGVTITVNTKELDDWLSSLPAKLVSGKVRAALSAAGEVMLESAKALCPERTDAATPGSTALAPGVLKESLTLQVQISKRFPPRVKVGAPDSTKHVMWWIENGFDHYSAGASGRRNRSKGKKGRHVEGKHVLAGAFDESAARAVDVLIENLKDAFDASKDSEDLGD